MPLIQPPSRPAAHRPPSLYPNDTSSIDRVTKLVSQATAWDLITVYCQVAS